MVMQSHDWDGRIARRLKLRDLHILATAVRCGSMAKAAARLAMSQPAVSESIANLEALLGVRLLDRSPRGIEPTRYADALLKRGDVVFDELRQGLRDIQFLTDPGAGEVRVACGDTVAAGLLPAAIDRLSRASPDIRVHVVQGNSEGLEFREVRERSVDFALARVATPFAEDDLDVERLFDDPHVVVAGADSALARRRKITLAQLASERWIFPSNRVIRGLVAAAFDARGLELPREHLTCNSILLRNQLLATGRFVTVLPASVVRYSGARWSLKALPIDLGVTPLSVGIVMLRDRTPSPVVEVFARHIRAAAKAIALPARRAGR